MLIWKAAMKLLFLSFILTLSVRMKWVLYASAPIPLLLQHTFGCVTISAFASIAQDRGIEPQSGQSEDYKIGICHFSACESRSPPLGRNTKKYLIGIRIMCLNEGTRRLAIAYCILSPILS